MANMTYKDACEYHAKTIDEFDADNLDSILNFSMACLFKLEAQILEDGGKVEYHLPAYRWNIKQAVINRSADRSMASAASEYVSNLQDVLVEESGLA